MKRTFLLLSSLLLFILGSNAQIRMALVGGGHQSKVLEDNNLPGWDQVKNNYKGRGGVHVGFIADLPFSENSAFSFQPGIIYYNKGRKYLYSVDSTVAYPRQNLPDSNISTFYSDSRKQYIDYIDLPLNVVYKIKLGRSAKFIIGAGPYVSFFYKGVESSEKALVGINFAKEENKDLSVGNGPGKYSTLDYGINGLAGFEFNRIFLTANYSRGLNNFYESTEHDGGFKHQVMGATLGIFLGKPIKMESKDKDGDGIPDKSDKCPDVAGLAQFFGCPDTDNDGIIDSEDGCPTMAGPIENKGCPYLDTDKDGVLDKDDKCPSVAGPKENAGCPYLDTDNDGLLDKDDKCPAVAGIAKYEGCPIPDSDGDGINDDEDKCPQVKGIKENNGCPEIKAEIKKKVEYAAKKIQFKINSSDLTTGSFKVLDEVAEVLKSNPELKIAIEGHSSSEGSREVNMRLSQSRADAVKTYLVKIGIDETKLSSIGYGPDKPINESKTPAERALNRRVELTLSNQ